MRGLGLAMSAVIRSDPAVWAKFETQVPMLDWTACWPWPGVLNSSGYGSISSPKAKKVVGAHVASYVLFKGDIPIGREVDHRCHTRACPGGKTCPHRACVNPCHLAVVTARENRLRGWVGQRARERAAARTHCRQGHPFAGENLRIRPSDGARLCVTCVRTRCRESARRARAGEPRLARGQRFARAE